MATGAPRLRRAILGAGTPGGLSAQLLSRLGGLPGANGRHSRGRRLGVRPACDPNAGPSSKLLTFSKPSGLVCGPGRWHCRPTGARADRERANPASALAPGGRRGAQHPCGPSSSHTPGGAPPPRTADTVTRSPVLRDPCCSFPQASGPPASGLSRPHNREWVGEEGQKQV